MRSGEVTLALGALLFGACRPAAPPRETHLPEVIVTPDGRESLGESFERADRAFDDADYEGAEKLYRATGDRARASKDKARARLGGTPSAAPRGAPPRAGARAPPPTPRPPPRLGEATSADESAAPLRAYEGYLATLATSAEDYRAPGKEGEVLTRGRVLARALRLSFYLDRSEESELAALDRALASLPKERLPLLDEMVLSAFAAKRALARGDEASASSALARGDYLASELRLDVLPKLPLEAAPHFFVRGDALGVAAKKLVFRPLPQNFAEVLEARCSLLLRAQSSYSDVMRAESAEYSARAGERIANLYESLHRDLVSMERPPNADTDERRELLDAALRLRYGILLEKAEKMMRHTLEMIDRTGLGEAARARAGVVEQRLREARVEEERALAKLPFPREELERLLREMEREAENARSERK